jgi:hypothetical protein
MRHSLTHLGLTQQLHKGLDHRVRSHHHAGIDHRGLRPEDRHSFGHQPARGTQPEFAIDRHHLRDRIGAQHLVGSFASSANTRSPAFTRMAAMSVR